MKRPSVKKVWVARDGDGELYAYERRPFYVESWGGIWMAPSGAVYKVINLLFDYLKSDDEPIESRILSDNLVKLKHFFER